MAVLTLQAGLQESLLELGEQVELHDANGVLVGYFMSPNNFHKLQYAKANSLVSDQELQEAGAQPSGKSLQEILANLRTL
jgi:hypothetical protein